MGDGNSQGPTFPYDKSGSEQRLKLRARFTLLLAVMVWALFITWCFVGSGFLLGAAIGTLIMAVLVRTGLLERILGA